MVLVPSWGFLYINKNLSEWLDDRKNMFSSPHGDFFILTSNESGISEWIRVFSSPHGDFFILTEKDYNQWKASAEFSSPHGDFFILTYI